MADEFSFTELIHRVRAGDQDAATQLVRHYEPTIRRVIRFRLTDKRLEAALDSVDICQSVLASFFVRAAAGQFDLDQPEQLVQLLVTMARNKLASQARKEAAQRRDRRRVTASGEMAELLAHSEITPSRTAIAKELLAEAQRRLTDDERALVQLRSEGESWEAIAARLGETAQNLRKRHSRALNRVSREIGLDEADDE